MKIISLLFFDMLLQPISIHPPVASPDASTSTSLGYNIVVHNKSSYTLLVCIGNGFQRPTLQGPLHTIMPGKLLQKTVDITLHPELLIIHTKKLPPHASDDADLPQLTVEQAYLYQLNKRKPSIALGTINGRKLVLKAIDCDNNARFTLVPKQKKLSFFTSELKKPFTRDELICKVLSPSSLVIPNIPNFELKNQTDGILTLARNPYSEQPDVYVLTAIPSHYYFETYIPPDELKAPDRLLLYLWLPDGTHKPYRFSFHNVTEQSTVCIAAVYQNISGSHNITFVPYQELPPALHAYESDRLLDYNIRRDDILLSPLQNY